MTKTEIATAIEVATRGAVWGLAPVGLRRKIICGLLDKLDEDGKETSAATKQVKKRKPRKAKAAPLTQHATGQEG